MVAINCTSTLADYKAIKGKLGAFEDLASSLPKANSPLPVTVANIGTMLTSKADCIENTRLAKGCDRQHSHYIGGIVGFSKETITFIALSLPTVVHATTNKVQTLEDQVNANEAMESALSMFDHQINLVCQTVLGHFSKTCVKKIDQKSLTASIILYMLLSVDQVQKLKEELDKLRAEAAHKVDQGDMNVKMIVPSHLAGLT